MKQGEKNKLHEENILRRSSLQLINGRAPMLYWYLFKNLITFMKIMTMVDGDLLVHIFML